jgi:tetratricopeptide (TPR) repeat protein
MFVQVKCSCGYFMQLPENWAGKQGRCPQCSRVLNIPAARPMASTKGTPRPAPAPTDAPLESGVDLSELPRTQPSNGAGPWRNPIWIVAFAGGAAFIALGLFMVLRGGHEATNGNVAPNDDSVVQATPQDTRDDAVFRPQIKTEPAQTDAGNTEQPSSDRPPDAGANKSAESAVAAAKSARTGGSTASLETWTMRDYGVLVPAGSSLIEVDGVAVPVRNPASLASQGGVVLVLPLGKHVVRFTKSDTPRIVEPQRWFSDAYRDAGAGLQDGGRWSFDRLLEQSRQSLDRFAEPLVPHFWGNYYWQQHELDAAARQYTWALEIAPTFAPAYFNLAALEQERGHTDAARRYLRLAELWNTQNAYGLAQGLGALRAVVGESDPTIDDDEPDWYVTARDVLTPRDRDMIAVLRSAAEFSTRITERAKILNNLGAYFEHVGKPEHALQSYRSAAAVLGTTKLSPQERRVIQGILQNLARVCRKADMPEYQRYERLQSMLQ